MKRLNSDRIRFSPRDWLADPKLNALGPASRFLYLRLFIFKLDGGDISPPRVHQALAATPEELGVAMNELKRVGLIVNGKIRKIPALIYGRFPIPNRIRREVMSRDGSECVYCFSKDDLQIDHVFPFSRGGSNEAKNLQVLCRTCNQAKGATI